jgi:hypothetical protein
MRLEFDFGTIKNSEFGLARKQDEGRAYYAVPVDAAVQSALLEMAHTTWELLQLGEDAHQCYDPSNRYGTTESLYLPCSDYMASAVRELHFAENIRSSAGAFDDPKGISIYFARFTDGRRRRLTAMRRATQFKGILRSKGRLIRIIDDTLQVIDDNIFKLDSTFDLLVDASNVHILHPNGFEAIGELQRSILEAVPRNLKEIAAQLDFVAFDNIEEYASRHPRAARCIASIRGQAENIDRSALRKLCVDTHVGVKFVKGRLVVEPGHELAFLEVLDRRRYEIGLVRGQPEQYRAGNRTKISK